MPCHCWRYLWVFFLGRGRLPYSSTVAFYADNPLQTLPSKVNAKKKAERRRSSCSSSSAGSTLYGATDTQEQNQSEETTLPLAEMEEGTKPQSIKSLIQDPAIRAIMTSGTFLMFTYTSFDVLFSLYSFTAIEDGGVGLPVRLPRMIAKG